MDKLKNLKKYLKDLKSVVVAFSSGVDSTFLLKVAHDVLGENAIAVTIKSSFFPNSELRESSEFCKVNNIEQIIVEVNEQEIEGFCLNPHNRCYLCKKEIFKNILKFAHKKGIEHVLEGSNLDDDIDYRPGFKAIKELKIKSPLKELGFKKDEIRHLSKELGLKTFNKPSFACLASRFAYGELITKEKLKMVEKSEQFLLNLGFHQLRVRIQSNIARIEVLPFEMQKVMDNRKIIYEKLKEFGFSYVALDLDGYRMGSMNEVLDENIKK